MKQNSPTTNQKSPQQTKATEKHPHCLPASLKTKPVIKKPQTKQTEET